jgi:hypothetical protein
MSAGYQDQYIEQGTTFNIQLSLDDANGNPYNLTGFTVNSSAKRSYYSQNPSIVFNSIILDANNGIIQLSANSAVTANVSSSKLVYDVVITQTSTGVVTRVLEGQIFISPGVTIA